MASSPDRQSLDLLLDRLDRLEEEVGRLRGHSPASQGTSINALTQRNAVSRAGLLKTAALGVAASVGVVALLEEGSGTALADSLGRFSTSSGSGANQPAVLATASNGQTAIQGVSDTGYAMVARSTQEGIGLYGETNAVYNSSFIYAAVEAHAKSSGPALFARSDAGYGVWARSNGGTAINAEGQNNGDGIVGASLSGTDPAIGGEGTGVSAFSGTGTGLYAEGGYDSTSTGLTAIAAVHARGRMTTPAVWADAADGYGVHAQSNGTAVYAESQQSGTGLLGTSASGTGVHGTSAGRGVLGEGTGAGTGVLGTSGSGYGVRAVTSGNAAVRGEGLANGTGVEGVSLGADKSHNGSGTGIHGSSGSGDGVLGESHTGYGVQARSTSGTGAYASGTQGIVGESRLASTMPSTQTDSGSWVSPPTARAWQDSAMPPTHRGWEAEQEVLGGSGTGSGVLGEGAVGVEGIGDTNGRGGQFSGGAAQIRLVPGS